MFEHIEDKELDDVAHLFYGDVAPKISVDVENDNYAVTVGDVRLDFTYEKDDYAAVPDGRVKRMAKIAAYDALCAVTGKTQPWGALCGVRPTKLFYELTDKGYSMSEAVRQMQTVYRVSDGRARLLREIVAAQSGKYSFPSEYYNLYVHVPYCTTRCTYCSFLSYPISKHGATSRKYVSLLCDEIRASVAAMKEHGKKLLSVYIGGGTPTALDDGAFCAMLDAIGDVVCEYTCEAGRPDTITAQKADIMREHGVTRVCVNPQSLNADTLVKIGRSHSVDEFYAAYDIAVQRGFEINCDLIAGLAEETQADFKRSFDGVKSLGPHNITVHTLSRKNGSAIRYQSTSNAQVADMVNYALESRGEYIPYYLYRQKRQAGNLENVGFTLDRHQCVNNITTMEETVTVMACGAGAISKIVRGGNIVRFANMRDVPLYIDRFEQKLKAKLDAFNAAYFG